MPVRVKSDKKRVPVGFRVTQEGRPLVFQVLGTETAPGGYISHTTLAVALTLAPQSFALLNVSFLDEPSETNAASQVSETAEEVAIRTDWGQSAGRPQYR